MSETYVFIFSFGFGSPRPNFRVQGVETEADVCTGDRILSCFPAMNVSCSFLCSTLSWSPPPAPRLSLASMLSLETWEAIVEPVHLLSASLLTWLPAAWIADERIAASGYSDVQLQQSAVALGRYIGHMLPPSGQLCLHLQNNSSRNKANVCFGRERSEG